MFGLFKKREDWKRELRDEIAQEIREEVIEDIIQEVKKEERLRMTEESEKHSSVTFIVENDLTVRLQTKINPDAIEALLQHNYLPMHLATDEEAIQFSFILLANEITDQIIEETNEVAGG